MFLGVKKYSLTIDIAQFLKMAVVKNFNRSCQIRQLQLSNSSTEVVKSDNSSQFQVETTVSKLQLFLLLQLNLLTSPL